MLECPLRGRLLDHDRERGGSRGEGKEERLMVVESEGRLEFRRAEFCTLRRGCQLASASGRELQLRATTAASPLSLCVRLAPFSRAARSHTNVHARPAPALKQTTGRAIGSGRRLLRHWYGRHACRLLTSSPPGRTATNLALTALPCPSVENCTPPRWVSAAKLVMSLRNLTRPFGPVSFIKLYQGWSSQHRRSTTATATATARSACARISTG